MAISLGTITTIGTDTNDSNLSIDVLDNSTSGKIALGYTNSNGQLQICTVSGTTITAGSVADFPSGGGVAVMTMGALGSGAVANAIRNGSNLGKTQAATISGTTPTVGGLQTFYNPGGAAEATPFSVAGLDATHYAILFTKQSSSNAGFVVINSISGTTVTIGSEAQVVSNDGGNPGGAIYALSSSAAIVIYQDGADSNKLKAVVVSVSGTTPTVNTAVTITTNVPTVMDVRVLDSTHFVAVYNESTGNKAWVVACSISGTTITVGTPVQLLANTANAVSVMALDSATIVAAYTDNSDSSKLKIIRATVSGTTITLDNASLTTVTTGAATWLFNGRAIVPLGTSKFFLAWTNAASGAAATKAVIATITNDTVLTVAQASFAMTTFAVALTRIFRPLTAVTASFSLSGNSISFIPSAWTRQSKHASVMTNTTKHTSIWADRSKDSSTFTNLPKS